MDRAAEERPPAARDGEASVWLSARRPRRTDHSGGTAPDSPTLRADPPVFLTAPSPQMMSHPPPPRQVPITLDYRSAT
ncbi:hypothetical protein Misp04_26210 [Micromonospora sp. NBRC 101691]|nr:hypothetical protein Misp04_26210 [Micromonospora sp. NBRC 101691]